MTNPSAANPQRGEECLRCGLCDAFCPALGAREGFPGPRAIGPDAARFRARAKSDPEPALSGCLGCGTCERVCPQGLGPWRLGRAAKEKIVAAKGLSVPEALLARSPGLGPLGSFLAPLSNLCLKSSLAKKALPVLGLDPSFPFPSYASKPLSKLLPRNQGEKPEALLFGGCFLEYNDPGPALAIIKVLGAAGVKTKAAEPVCCGLPSLIKGDKARAERVAKKSLSRLAPVLEGFEGPLLFASPSCLWMAREFWPLLVKTPQAAKVASQAAEAGAFLLSLAQSGKLPKFSKSSRLLAYQAPCHLALSQAPWPAFDLIGLIEGARLFDLGQGCCGQGGTYGMEAANASVAKAASEKLSRALAERPYEAVVSECEACRMRLGAVSGLKTLHPFEVLAEAL